MRPRNEDGLAVMELLVAMTVSIMLLGATLTAFNVFLSHSSTLVKTDEALSKTRLGVDRVARQLRNLANPTTSGSSIDLAHAYDFVFQTSDPVKRRVRYCLASSSGGTHDVLWFQSASTAAAMTTVMTASCPGSGWSTQSVVADHVVNRVGAADRHVFTYGCSAPLAAWQWCSWLSVFYPRIKSARLDLYLDVNSTGTLPNAVRMSTAVHLRNQNEPPTAAVAPPSTAGARTVLLNGSASTDPEGRTMEFQWFKGSATLPAPVCAGGPAAQGAIGQGVTLTHTFPATDASPQQIRLRVIDPGCLYAVATLTSVTIP